MNLFLCVKNQGLIQGALGVPSHEMRDDTKQPFTTPCCKFPLLIKLCSSSPLPSQHSNHQLIQPLVSKWLFSWRSSTPGKMAAWQTFVYPHLHAPNQTDFGRTPTCCGGAKKIWLKLEMTQITMFPLPLQQTKLPRELRITWICHALSLRLFCSWPPV